MARGLIRPLTDSGFPLLDFEIPLRTRRRILPSLRCSSVHSLHAFCTAETKSARRENPASECGAFTAIDSWALFPCRAQKARRNDREGSALRTLWRGGTILFSKGMGGWNRSEVVSALTVVPAGCQDICDGIQVRIFRANVGGCCPLELDSGSAQQRARGGSRSPHRDGGNRAAPRFQQGKSEQPGPA